MRPLLTAASSFVKLHVRGAFFPLIGAAYLAIVLALPTAGRAGSLERPRSAASTALSFGGMALLVAALTLPAASLAQRRGLGPGGRLWHREWLLSGIMGHGLVLLTAAVVLSVLSMGVIWLREGGRLEHRDGVVRECVGEGPPARSFIGEGLSERKFEFRFETPRILRSAKDQRFTAEVRLAPRVILDLSAGASRSTGFRCEARVRCRVNKTDLFRETVTFVRGRPGEFRLEVSSELATHQLEIVFEQVTPGLVLDFPVGSVKVLTAPLPLFSTVVRGFLISWTAAVSLSATCAWFSGFMAFPLAMAGCLVLFLSGFLAPEWIPGALHVEPARRVAEGIAIVWSDLLLPTAKAMLIVLLVTVLAYVDPRVGGRRGSQ